MQTYELAGTIPVEDKIEATDARDAVNRYVLLNGYLPDRVGNRNVIGVCEDTEVPILEGDDYETQTGDDDEVYILKKRVDGLEEDATGTFEEDGDGSDAAPTDPNAWMTPEQRAAQSITQ